MKQIRLLLRHAALYANRRPWLRRPLLAVLNRIPALKVRLQRFSMGLPMTPPRRSVPTELAHLSPRARQIYADLKSALDRRQQENR